MMEKQKYKKKNYMMENYKYLKKRNKINVGEVEIVK